MCWLVARTMAVSGDPTCPHALAAGGAGMGLWALVLLGLVVTAWLNHLLRRAGRLDLAQRGAPPVRTALAALSAATVGAVVASRRPSHPVGWLLLGLGLSVPWSDVLDGWVDYGVLARPGSLPAARYLAVYSPAVFMAGLACVGFVLLLTPSGSLPSPSRRWRWWARALGAAPVVFLLTVALMPEPLDPAYESIANPLGLPGGLPVEVPLLVLNLLAGAVVLADRAGRVWLAGGAVPPCSGAGTPAVALAGVCGRPGLGRRGPGAGRHLAADQPFVDLGLDHLGCRGVPGPAAAGDRRRDPALPPV